MRFTLFKIFLLSLVVSCSHSRNKGESGTKLSVDTSKKVDCINPDVIRTFKQEEKSALDSISKYNLKLVYDSCLLYLYVIYGDNFFHDTCIEKKSTIGECNIKLVGVIRKSNSIWTLIFIPFIQDSIPIGPFVKTSMGNMINSFDINVETKKLLTANFGENGRIEIMDIQKLYNSALRSQSFNDYIKSKKMDLHSKFSKLLQNE